MINVSMLKTMALREVEVTLDHRINTLEYYNKTTERIYIYWICST
jgi:hypothetical protein